MKKAETSAEPVVRSRYVIVKEQDRVRLGTQRSAHLGLFLYQAGFCALMWYAGLGMKMPASDWPARVLLVIVALLVTRRAVTELIAVTIGDAFVIDREADTVTRYGRRLCGVRDIRAVRYREIGAKAQSLVIELVLHNARPVILDHIFPTPMTAVGPGQQRDSQNAAGTLADFLRVPLEGDGRKRKRR